MKRIIQNATINDLLPKLIVRIRVQKSNRSDFDKLGNSELDSDARHCGVLS